MRLRGVALLFALTLVTGCKAQPIAERSRFVEDGVQKIADGGWDAERIEVENLGVSPTGGLGLTATDTDRVVATARMVAVAASEDKPSADQAILSATDGFVVTTASGITRVQCGHGAAVGSAPAAESGCDALDVAVPSGTPEKPLTIVARSGNGKVGVSFGGATLAALDLRASHGGIDVTTTSTPGATISIVSETGDDVVLRLPREFAADTLTLEAPTERIDTSAFPDVQAGRGRGEAGRGARVIVVKAGRITLAAQ